MKGYAQDTEVFWRPLEFIIKKYEPNDEIFVESTQHIMKEKYNKAVGFIKRCILRRRILSAVKAANLIYTSEIHVLNNDVVLWLRFWKKIKWNKYRVKFTFKKINDEVFREINGGLMFDRELAIDRGLASVLKDAPNRLIFVRIILL